MFLKENLREETAKKSVKSRLLSDNLKYNLIEQYRNLREDLKTERLKSLINDKPAQSIDYSVKRMTKIKPYHTDLIKWFRKQNKWDKRILIFLFLAVIYIAVWVVIGIKKQYHL